MMKNACEAMEENGSIHMQLSRDQKNATLIIADNGPGIPSEQLEKIFHPFFTTKETGTGLGLSICYKIVQDHHGTIGSRKRTRDRHSIYHNLSIVDEKCLRE